MTRRAAAVMAFAVVMLGASGSGAAQSAVPPALVCKLPRDSGGTLPPTARHGLISHLPQYPAVSLEVDLRTYLEEASFLLQSMPEP